MGAWLWYSRALRQGKSKAGGMDATTITAIVALAMLGAGVGAAVRALLGLYVAPWPGVPPCGTGTAASRRLFGAAPPLPHLPATSIAVQDGPTTGSSAAASVGTLGVQAELSPELLRTLSLSSPHDEKHDYDAAQATLDDLDTHATVLTRRRNGEAAGVASPEPAPAPVSSPSSEPASVNPRALQAQPSGCLPLFPASTFIANICGSFILGIFARLSGRYQWSPLVLAAVGTGFCGGLTTMSTFVNEVIVLFSTQQAATACLYWFATQAACLLLGWAGWGLGGAGAAVAA